MQRTYRVCGARAGLAAIGAMLVLLGLPGTSIAGAGSAGRESTVDAGEAVLARGAGYAEAESAREVRALQRVLRKLGWQPGPADGLFGPRTENAVVRAQRAAGLAPDGIVGPLTTRALERALRRPLRAGTGYAQPDGSPRVRALQTRLRELGFEPGPLDGDFGPRTQAAVKRLQRAGGTTADGIVGAPTRRLLADGSSALEKELDRSQPTPGATPDRTRGGRRDGTQARSDSGVDRRIRKATDPEGSKDTATDSGGPTVLLLLGTALFTLVLGVLVGVLLGGPRGRRRGTRDSVGDPSRPSGVSAGQDEVQEVVAATPAAKAQDEPGPGQPLVDGVRALGYVSFPETGPQNGPGLKEQMEAIDSLCERRGWRLLELVRDREEPRGKALERPGLGYALERVARGEASCVVVSELRHLSRSVADLGRTLEVLGRGGVRLVAVEGDVDTASSEGRKAAEVLVSVGAWERDRLAERTRRGLEAARAQGGRISRPSVNDVPALKEWIAQLRASGLTLQAIADRLNAEGVPTLRGGEKWRPSSVQTAAGYRRPNPPSGAMAGDEGTNGRETRMN
jgi:peptidoglycan hydrolase-like protein with peptidoglycan-binding domain/DNA invertase Pin-like site-specific DNA recombinase